MDADGRDAMVRGQAASRRRRVLVLGAGLAGLAASEALIRHYGSQVEVSVLEGRQCAGGRVGSFQDPKMNMTVDYCQHVAMGCCANFLDLMRRCDLEAHWDVCSSLRFASRDFSNRLVRTWKWLPAPLHQLPILWRLPFVSIRNRFQIQIALWKIMRWSGSDCSDGVTAQNWLLAQGQSRDSIELFWDVFACSALGETTDNISFASLRHLFVDGFVSHRDASDLWIPRAPLSEIFGVELVTHLRSLGVQMEFGSFVERIDQHQAGFRIVTKSGDAYEADHVISAVPWHQVGKLTETITDLRGLKAAADLQTSSITGIHLWFDRPLGDWSHLISVGTATQWIFRPVWRSRPMVESASHQLDASHYYYQVVISGSQHWKHLSNDELQKIVLEEIRELSPSCRDARLVCSRVVTDPRAVIVCHPDVDKSRPPSRTALPRFHLAGDWTATGWPSTMEGAVISGRNAVASLARQEGWDFSNGYAQPKQGWVAKMLVR